MNSINEIESPRVLSIQSHVVHGYVGNKAAILPLQLNGFEVDFINSVQFSNHTQYGHIRGDCMDAKQLNTLFEGLTLNGIDQTYTHLLSGYCGDPTFLRTIASIAQSLKKSNPNLMYLCDPVLGDYIPGIGRKMYVPDTLPEIYQKYILPLADIVVPNQYEAEILTGIKVNDEHDACVAMNEFHKMGIKMVVISSTEFNKMKKNEIVILGSYRPRSDGNSADNISPIQVRMTIPLIEAVFTGSGDAFASLLLATLHKYNNDIKTALEETVSTLTVILENTVNHAAKSQRHLTKECGDKSVPSVSIERMGMELKLIQSIQDILNPKIKFTASML